MKRGLTDGMLTELAYLFGLEADLVAPIHQWPTKSTKEARAEAERLRYTATAIAMRRTKPLKIDRVLDKIAARYAAKTNPGEEPR